jgi:O-antigen/teichoic acid export membrane protein
VLFSSFSQRQNDPEEVRALLKKGLMAVSVLSFPVYIGLCVVARYFIVGLMGEKWAPMVIPFQVVAASYVVRSVGGLLVSVDVGIGRYKAYTARYFLAGCVFVVSCILLLPYGAVGMSIAFFLFAVTSVGLAFQLTVAATGVGWGEALRAFRPAAVATSLMALSTSLLSWALPAPTIINLFVLSAAGALTYSASLAAERDPSFRLLRRSLFADWTKLIGG